MSLKIHTEWPTPYFFAFSRAALISSSFGSKSCASMRDFTASSYMKNKLMAQIKTKGPEENLATKVEKNETSTEVAFGEVLLELYALLSIRKGLVELLKILISGSAIAREC